jgi:hypothetical protein
MYDANLIKPMEEASSSGRWYGDDAVYVRCAKQSAPESKALLGPILYMHPAVYTGCGEKRDPDGDNLQ